MDLKSLVIKEYEDKCEIIINSKDKKKVYKLEEILTEEFKEYGILISHILMGIKSNECNCYNCLLKYYEEIIYKINYHPEGEMYDKIIEFTKKNIITKVENDLKKLISNKYTIILESIFTLNQDYYKKELFDMIFLIFKLDEKFKILEKIDSFKKLKFKNTLCDKKCMICLENIKMGEEVIKCNSCNNFFHFSDNKDSCFYKYLDNKYNQCPLCKCKLDNWIN